MKKGVLFFLLFLTFLCFSFVSGYEFNGTVYNLSGVALNNTLVNITIRNQQFAYVGSNSTTTNASGAFNFTVTENQTWFYQPVITLTENDTVTFVGQSLPALDFYSFTALENIKFYLRPAGTFNITAYNSSWVLQGFMYMIVDQQLDYPIAELFTSTKTNIVVSVPRERNYTIMLFPNGSLPVFFDWNNFSSDASYNMSTISKYSNYNATTRTVQKEFNLTMSLIRTTGYMQNVTGPVDGWTNLTIVPFLLMPGNVIAFDDADLPFNMSYFWTTAGQGSQTGDKYNETSPGLGYYNITLPTSAEGANYMLFGTAKNNSDYYGGYANISVTYGGSGIVRNISLYGLAGGRENISLTDPSNSQEVNITTARKPVTLLNQSNATLTSFSALVRTVVNYSAYGAIKFTFSTDIDQERQANFTLPLLNVTGIDRMDVLTQQYAPRKISFTTAQVNSHLNTTLKVFTPGEIDGSITAGNIFMVLYFSNSSCDLPSPPAPCQIGSSESMETNEPLKAIMGGGKISFRMKTGNISVHYVNVDMLASGPPDALFDDSTSNGSTGTSFASAMRFGSGGPTVYEYILVGMPYSDATSGLDENNTVNISIPYLYSENWSLIWNVTLNGTDAAALAGNYSDYLEKQSAWSVLMNPNNTCGTTQTSILLTAPCYINKSVNEIWLRIPHFSGTGPKVVGSSVAATTSSSSSSSSSAAAAQGEKKSTTKEKEDVVEEETKEAQAPKDLGEVGDVPFDLEDSSSWVEGGSLTVDAQEGTVYALTFVTSLLEAEEHTVLVQEIDEEQALVVLLVQSEGQEVFLVLSSGKEVDLDGDGENDLLITFDALEEGTASLTFTKLETWVAREELFEEAQKQRVSSLIWIVLVVVALSAGAFFLFFRKKK